MKKKICAGTFMISFLLMSATAEALWTLPICLTGIIISTIIGKLWEWENEDKVPADDNNKQIDENEVYYPNINHDVIKL